MGVMNNIDNKNCTDERVTVVPVHEVQGEEHVWDLVRSRLAHLSAYPKAEELIWWYPIRNKNKPSETQYFSKWRSY